MLSHIPPLLLLAVGGLSIYLVSLVARFFLRNSKLPPGPKGWPLIGNLNDVPHELAWKTYAQWGKKYGEVCSFTMFGQHTIVLNSHKAANELLDKRSYNYSDRPRMVMANELLGWEWDFAHMQYSDWWRRHRRVFHQYFQPRNLASYYPVQKHAADRLIDLLLSNPSDFSAHVRQFVTSIVLKVTYGYEVKKENDFYVELATKAIQPLLSVVHAGTHVVEYVPALKYLPTWLPGTGFKRNAKETAKSTYALRDIPFDMVQEQMAEGSAEQSFVSDNLNRLKVRGLGTPEEVEVVKNCAGMAYLAGSDTTASLLRTFILAMAHFPRVQAKAQALIDEVTQGSRLPDFSDRDSIPYLDALLLEVMRWGPITPLALPHRAMEDDVYEGYLIPAGATVTANAWAILYDPELYPEPTQFRPERFIETEQTPVCPDPIAIGAFGFGRRICPGRYLATNSAWIAMGSILASFKISKLKDEHGMTVEPLIKYTDGVVSHPAEFKVDIQPRSKAAAALIEAQRFGTSAENN